MGTVANPPPSHLVALARHGVDVYVLEPSDNEVAEHPKSVQLVKVASWPATGVELAHVSPRGKFIAIGTPVGVKLIDTSTFKDFTIIKGCPAKIQFSPKETHIVILVATSVTPPEHNLIVWDIEKNILKASCYIKRVVGQEVWPVLHWNDTEAYCFRLLPTVLQVLSGDLSTGFVADRTFEVDKPSQLEISPQKQDGTVNVAIFTRPRGSSPGKVEILNTSSTTEPELLNRKTLFQTERVSMTWNKLGTTLLLITEMDDVKKQSYYGTSALHYIEAKKNGQNMQVIEPEKGPVSDCSWSPTTNEFIVISGRVPSSMKLYDGCLGTPKLSFGEARRNFIKYNPFGRFFLLAGFGNLAGDVDVWDKNKKQIIGNFRASCTTECQWCPDGQLILCASTTPRMRVDNGIRIYRYNGDLLTHLLIPELYSVMWLPVVLGTYPDKPAVYPKVNIPTTKDVYRPPGSSLSMNTQTTLQTTAEIISKPCLVPGADYKIGGPSKSAKRNAAKRKKAKEAVATTNVIPANIE